MFSDVLLAHLNRYPKMQLEDCVKLAYQSEFGPGHLLRDPQKALSFLKREMETAPGNDDPLYLPIGNGLCRVSLPACRERGITPEALFPLFQKAAETVKGDEKAFDAHLKEISELVEQETLPYEPAQADYFFILYREKGCPALHHSDAYRAAYHPAYRVVWQKQFKDFVRAFTPPET